MSVIRTDDDIVRTDFIRPPGAVGDPRATDILADQLARSADIEAKADYLDSLMPLWCSFIDGIMSGEQWAACTAALRTHSPEVAKALDQRIENWRCQRARASAIGTHLANGRK